MIVKFFTFLLIILAIGSGVGYWLLVTAELQDTKWLRLLGKFLGWVIILLSILISLFCFYFKLSSKSIMADERPMYPPPPPYAAQPYYMYYHHHHCKHHHFYKMGKNIQLDHQKAIENESEEDDK